MSDLPLNDSEQARLNELRSSSTPMTPEHRAEMVALANREGIAHRPAPAPRPTPPVVAATPRPFAAPVPPAPVPPAPVPPGIAPLTDAEALRLLDLRKMTARTVKEEAEMLMLVPREARRAPVPLTAAEKTRLVELRALSVGSLRPAELAEMNGLTSREWLLPADPSIYPPRPPAILQVDVNATLAALVDAVDYMAKILEHASSGAVPALGGMGFLVGRVKAGVELARVAMAPK